MVAAKHKGWAIGSSNRTFMELKFLTYPRFLRQRNGSNRTFMELKWN